MSDVLQYVKEDAICQVGRKVEAVRLDFVVSIIFKATVTWPVEGLIKTSVGRGNAGPF